MPRFDLEVKPQPVLPRRCGQVEGRGLSRTQREAKEEVALGGLLLRVVLYKAIQQELDRITVRRSSVGLHAVRPDRAACPCRLLGHLVGAGEQRRRYFEAKRPGSWPSSQCRRECGSAWQP